MHKLLGMHAVEEALVAGSPVIDRLVIARGRHGRRTEDLVNLARARGIPVRFEERRQVDLLAGTQQNQGIVALIAAMPSMALDDLLAKAKKTAMFLLLDGVEDPHNLGALIRSALVAGADGVVIPERRASGLTETVARASAGALAHMPIARVKNIPRAMEDLKLAGYWLLGLDENAGKRYTDVDMTVPIGIVLGNEGQGLHELTRKRCDYLASVPASGPLRSLNVSVAAGVVLFEAVRQRCLRNPSAKS